MKKCKTGYGWIRMNGIYYVYDRKTCCIPSCLSKEYYTTTIIANMIKHLEKINKLVNATQKRRCKNVEAYK